MTAPPRGVSARWAVAAGALLAAVAVAAGAFGAHGLEGRLEPRAIDQWETAFRYLMYAALGTVASGLCGARLAGSLLIAGGLIFAGSVGAIALGAPSILGAVAPVGGLSMILGFVALAWAGWRSA
ncbi:MAG: DUF423 domain-containing protein [Acidobacteriota bacterium]